VVVCDAFFDAHIKQGNPKYFLHKEEKNEKGPV
jgi:hypothetical protein